MHLIHWCYTCGMFSWDLGGGGGCPGISTKISANLSRDLPSLGWQVCTVHSLFVPIGTFFYRIDLALFSGLPLPLLPLLLFYNNAGE